MASMRQIGVTHRRVFTHDIHAANLVRIAFLSERFVHDLDDRVAGFVIKLHLPKVFKPRMRLWVVHTLVVGQHHRDQTRIACALHIVLSTQRMQARAGAAYVPGDRGQGNQAARVVCAVHMLAHAHAPENHGAFGRGVRACHFSDGGGIDAALLLDCFR